MNSLDRSEPRIDMDQLAGHIGAPPADGAVEVPRFLRPRPDAPPPAPPPPVTESEAIGEQAATATLCAEQVEAEIRSQIEKVEQIAADIRGQGLAIIDEMSAMRGAFIQRVENFEASAKVLHQGLRDAWAKVAERGTQRAQS